jgi:uncharacterized membrane protein YgdD (TMEM256/DUF423 family)
MLISSLIITGSLYILAATEDRRWGRIAPIGGISYCLGWATLALASKGRLLK